MLPWTFEPSVFVASAFSGWKIGAGICGGFVFVERILLTKEEDGSALIAGMCDPRWYVEPSV